ncbi:N(4)-acetylcytidine aminohydrolase [Otariodibacter sp.]|uniref:N(4)-acetylcytidine aminohydrolase n=1 Tax=Otariodibacter sp. TaxID=3030919 RepID=UPI00261BF741|nr:N(4)-acetylcytidine aminohydrolase [Otariodibacter sp.]
MNKITFFSRFESDIISGKKTITIRDKSESYFKPTQILDVFTNETDLLFAKIQVISVTPITFDQLSEQHAQQENMTLEQLKRVIKEIYPTENQFFVIEFKLINEPI